MATIFHNKPSPAKSWMTPADIDLWRAYTATITRRRSSRLPNVPRPVQPSRRPQIGHTLDLHGLSLTEAHARTSDFVWETCGRYKFVTVITGVSGAIRQEFQHWIDHHPDVRRWEQLPGGGAFRLHYRQIKSG